MDSQTNRPAFFHALPKVDLHRHLEGSIRLETLLDIGQQYHLPLPGYDLDTLRPLVQVTPSASYNLENFLAKFQMLRGFYRSPEVVKRITSEAIVDAAADNVRYLELRFTPVALASQMHCTINDVMTWVCDEANREAVDHNMGVGFIVSINRHESIELGLTAVEAALAFRDQGVVGIDLAGRETGYPARPFGPLFSEARQDGLCVTIHAGEWQGPDNVRDTIDHMAADRIGHGVRVVERSDVVQYVLERDIPFELCPTSNVHTGAVTSLMHYPLCDLYYLGVPVTINTDDPGISNICLSDEYALVVDELGLTIDGLLQVVLNGAHAAFLPEDQQTVLAKSLQIEFEAVCAAYDMER